MTPIESRNIDGQASKKRLKLDHSNSHNVKEIHYPPYFKDPRWMKFRDIILATKDRWELYKEETSFLSERAHLKPFTKKMEAFNKKYKMEINVVNNREVISRYKNDVKDIFTTLVDLPLRAPVEEEELSFIRNQFEELDNDDRNFLLSKFIRHCCYSITLNNEMQFPIYIYTQLYSQRNDLLFMYLTLFLQGHEPSVENVNRKDLAAQFYEKGEECCNKKEFMEAIINYSLAFMKNHYCDNRNQELENQIVYSLYVCTNVYGKLYVEQGKYEEALLLLVFPLVLCQNHLKKQEFTQKNASESEALLNSAVKMIHETILKVYFIQAQSSIREEKFGDALMAHLHGIWCQNEKSVNPEATNIANRLLSAVEKAESYETNKSSAWLASRFADFEHRGLYMAYQANRYFHLATICKEKEKPMGALDNAVMGFIHYPNEDNQDRLALFQKYVEGQRRCNPFKHKSPQGFTQLLPEEIVQYIFSYLDIGDLLRLEGVSKGCRNSVSNEFVWSQQIRTRVVENYRQEALVLHRIRINKFDAPVTIFMPDVILNKAAQICMEGNLLVFAGNSGGSERVYMLQKEGEEFKRKDSHHFDKEQKIFQIKTDEGIRYLSHNANNNGKVMKKFYISRGFDDPINSSHQIQHQNYKLITSGKNKADAIVAWDWSTRVGYNILFEASVLSEKIKNKKKYKINPINAKEIITSLAVSSSHFISLFDYNVKNITGAETAKRDLHFFSRETQKEVILPEWLQQTLTTTCYAEYEKKDGIIYTAACFADQIYNEFIRFDVASGKELRLHIPLSSTVEEAQVFFRPNSTEECLLDAEENFLLCIQGKGIIKKKSGNDIVHSLFIYKVEKDSGTFIKEILLERKDQVGGLTPHFEPKEHVVHFTPDLLVTQKKRDARKECAGSEILFRDPLTGEMISEFQDRTKTAHFYFSGSNVVRFTQEDKGLEVDLWKF